MTVRLPNNLLTTTPVLVLIVTQKEGLLNSPSEGKFIEQAGFVPAAG